jgi:hypothetical protein
MEKIEDQLERFADSPGHILHAKIIGGTRDGVVARASNKFPAGNQRKSAAGAQAATHRSSKSAAIGNPAPGKHPLLQKGLPVTSLLGSPVTGKAPVTSILSLVTGY